MNEISRVVSQVILVISTISLLSCAVLTGEHHPTAGSPEDFQEIIDTAMAKYRLPGVIAGIWVNGKEYWIQAKGKADISTGREIKPYDRVRIGSITKTFVSTVLLQLVDEGKVRLDDRLDKFAPNAPNAQNITIRQLLNHTSGLYDYEEIIFKEPSTFDPLKKWTVQELLVIGLSRNTYFAPGEGWHYSNTGYILLGMIIEKITGNTIDDEIRKRIIVPLGLKHTSVPNGPDIEGEYAHGYWDKENNGVLGDVSRFDPSCEWVVGAMISSLDDLKVWSDALIQGKLLSKSMHDEQMTWTDTDPNDQGSMKYGLGIMKLWGMIGHTGAVPGYETAMFSMPEKNATIIIFINRFGPSLSDSSLLPVLNEFFLRLRKLRTK
jgi:D-alanyl-D-alanine carboxypeptidase